jgi:hypothetical protein
MACGSGKGLLEMALPEEEMALLTQFERGIFACLRVKTGAAQAEEEKEDSGLKARAAENAFTFQGLPP